jgi:hypothetical protein
MALHQALSDTRVLWGEAGQVPEDSEVLEFWETGAGDAAKWQSPCLA